jgi:hypothetical protein
MNAGEVNEDGQPLDQRTLMTLSRVCGLAARQRVPLTLEKFEDLIEDEKNELFMNSIQWYIVYLEELKEKGKRASMKGISHSWRRYKNGLVICLRSSKTWKKKTGNDLSQSVNLQSLYQTVSTCGNSERRMSLTTTLATLDMQENRASGNRRIRDWSSKVSRIHMTNSVDN